MPRNSTYDEQQVIERLRHQATARDAFAEVINHYSSPLYWQIRRIVIDHDDTADVLQNTFIKAWTSIDNFRGDAKLSTWLYKIAVNESITFVNRKKQQAGLSLDDENTFLTASLESDPYFDGDNAQIRLQQAIESLPEKQRLVFTMRYYDEMRYEQISEILGTSVGALKASYHHAVKKIEAFFEQND